MLEIKINKIKNYVEISITHKLLTLLFNFLLANKLMLI